MHEKGKLVMYMKDGKYVAVWDSATDPLPAYFLDAKTGIRTITADLKNTTSAFAGLRGGNLTRFYGKLSALSDGNQLFGASRVLDAKSIKGILTSIPKYTSGSHPLQIGRSVNWKDDEEIAQMLDATTPIAAGTYRCYELNEDGSVGDDKGWTITVTN